MGFDIVLQGVTQQLGATWPEVKEHVVVIDHTQLTAAATFQDISGVWSKPAGYAIVGVFARAGSPRWADSGGSITRASLGAGDGSDPDGYMLANSKTDIHGAADGDVLQAGGAYMDPGNAGFGNVGPQTIDARIDTAGATVNAIDSGTAELVFRYIDTSELS